MKRPSERKTAPICWLFCSVIDNYGDIGVSWRLAQILQRELGWQVHLWLDDEAALRALSPGLPSPPCTHENIVVHRWQPGRQAEGLDGAPNPQIVIETFGCDLPADVLQKMRQTQPLWLNWEYLSAEAAHEALHARPSLQADGLQKYFWFMGFSEKSGGLLREADYAQRSQSGLSELRSRLGLPPKNRPEWLLFGYRSPIWPQWFEMWQQAGAPIRLLVAGKEIIESLQQARALPANALQQPGDCFQTACVELVRLPFVPQHDFDRLLALADGLIIRGEDSFVRAQWAAKPFFWHIYPQDEMAHLDKLHAFWQRAYAHYPPAVRTAHRALSDELNGTAALDVAARLAAWQALQNHLPAWQQAAEGWQQSLRTQPAATEKLANFIQDKLK